MAEEHNPVGWFEIPVKDLERAKKFYRALTGVAFAGEDMEMNDMKMAMFPMAEKAPGAAGALVKAKGYKPSHDGTVVYFMLGDIDAALAKVKAAGGKTLLPKTEIGQYGFVAHFEDTEGNRVALHQM